MNDKNGLWICRFLGTWFLVPGNFSCCLIGFDVLLVLVEHFIECSIPSIRVVPTLDFSKNRPVSPVMESTSKSCGSAPSVVSSCNLSGSGRSGSGSGAGEMQWLEEAMDCACKRIRENESRMTSANAQLDSNQIKLKELQQDRSNAMTERKRVDVEIQSLNGHITTKRDAQMKLQGSLQYRREDSLLEAINRLESQLATHNYKVTEEKKIVQEIDRLKRSKKSLREYNTLKDELELIMSKQRTMRNQRDSSFHQLTSLRNKEDSIKRETSEIRQQVDLLKKEIDGLYDQKRKLKVEIKTVKSNLHLRELERPHPKRTVTFTYKKTGGGHQHQQSPVDCGPKGTSESFGGTRRKERCGGRRSPDGHFPFSEIELLCGTLITYLSKLIGAPSPVTSALNTPADDLLTISGQGSPQTEIYEGDKQLTLYRRQDEELHEACLGGKIAVGGARSKRKEKKEKRKTQQNKLLVHTADIVEQFFKLHIRPPSTLGDIGQTLDSLEAKKQHLAQLKIQATTPTVPKSEEVVVEPEAIVSNPELVVPKHKVDAADPEVMVMGPEIDITDREIVVGKPDTMLAAVAVDERHGLLSLASLASAVCLERFDNSPGVVAQLPILAAAVNGVQILRVATENAGNAAASHNGDIELNGGDGVVAILSPLTNGIYYSNGDLDNDDVFDDDLVVNGAGGDVKPVFDIADVSVDNLVAHSVPNKLSPSVLSASTRPNSMSNGVADNCQLSTNCHLTNGDATHGGIHS